VIQVFPDEDLVESLLNIVAPSIWYALFSNNLTPTDSNVIGDFTQAVIGPGATLLAQKVLPGAFTLQAVSGHIGKITAPDITISNVSGFTVTVYGYLAGFGVTANAVTDLLLAARFDVAPLVLAPGDTVNITPTLSLRSAS
jgi:hypothetical protein